MKNSGRCALLIMGTISASICPAAMIRNLGRKISPMAVTIFVRYVPVTDIARNTLISTRNEPASICRNQIPRCDLSRVTDECMTAQLAMDSRMLRPIIMTSHIDTAVRKLTASDWRFTGNE